jgi:UDP-N-acetylmuramoyl-tripeptide--D-alanyl-D-alanine ligase
MRITTGEAARITGGELVGPADVKLTGVALDSRDARPGDLFVALIGSRVDGHDFVADAAAGGAAAVLVSRTVSEQLSQILVDDTASALQILGEAQRRAGDYRLVGVTGSVGKTTTKEFLAAIMATTYAVGFTRGSRNSQVGLPAELCNQPPSIDWLVAELGMNHAGELDRLGALTRPDALLYTVVAPVHLEFFPDVDAIADAKAELIPHLHRDGLLVLNANDDRVAAMATRFDGRIVTYGIRGESQLWIGRYLSRGLLGAEMSFEGEMGPIELEWHIAGRHQAENLLAAACCAVHLGVVPNEVVNAAATMQSAPHRGQVHRTAAGYTVVDDSYNASPVAVRRLLELLAETPGRRVAVLGEMLELGALTDEAHREAGRFAADICHLLVAVGGGPAREMAEAARAAGLRNVETTADADAAAEILRQRLEDGDVVLVKGSRGVELDRTVAALLREEAA